MIRPFLPRLRLHGGALCLTSLLLLLITGCTSGRIIQSSTRTVVPFEAMMEQVADARLVLVGETHDEKGDHLMQLRVIGALHDRGKKMAIGAEMFAASSQPQLDVWNEGRMDSLSFEWLFSDNWSEPWPLYRDIFLYARANRVSVLGLNFSKELMRKISTQGTTSLNEQEASELPRGISCDGKAPYTEFLKGIYRTHSEKVGTFENFCVAQAVWNKGMARRLAEYLARHPDETVVALVGTFHAVREGIPSELPEVAVRVLVPDLPGLAEAGPGVADFVFRH